MQSRHRNSTLEILRFFFMFCVVVSHVYAHGSGLNAEFMNGLGDSWHTIHHYLVLTVSKIGVVGFMLISGFMGIRLNVRKLIVLSCTVLFYTYATYIYDSGSFNILHALKHTTNYWFVHSYIAVAIIATLFEPALENLSHKTWAVVIVCLSIYYGLFHLYLGMNDHTTDFLLFIYLMGRYLQRYPPHIIKKESFKAFYITSIICTGLYIIGAFAIPNSYQGQWRSNDNLLIVGICYGCILWCVNHPKYNKFINYWSSSILGIYLITESWIIRPYNADVLAVVMENYPLGMLLIVSICIVSIFIDKIRFMLFKKIEHTIEFIYLCCITKKHDL